MLSPTIALRCSHCQHALAISDIRAASTCPACGEAHYLPPAAADALALYERVVQQTFTDLTRADPATAPLAASQLAAPPGSPAPPAAPASPAPPAAPASAPPPVAGESPAPPAAAPPAAVESPAPPAAPESAAGGPPPTAAAPPGPPVSSAIPADAPLVSSASPADAPPVSSASPADAPPVSSAISSEPIPSDISADPAPSDSPGEAAGESAAPPVSSVSPADAVRAPVTARPIDPAALSGRAAISGEIADAPTFGSLASDPAVVHPGAPTLEYSPPGVPTVPRAPDQPGASAGPPARIGPATLSGLTARDSLSGPSHSSLLSIVYGRSTTDLAAAPLEVAAVREPAADQEPARTASDLVATLRSVLPDRPDRASAGPEPEGRIPATALAVARRALLARYADERRRQQVREGNLGAFFSVVICVFLVVAGYWYVAVPIALLALVLRLRRDERAERFALEVQRLADALGGQRLATYDAIAAWFDSLWPAPVSPEAMWTSHLHGAVRCDVRGYAVLLDVHLNEKTAGGIVYPPRITAYLAAVWPGRVPSLRPSATDLSPDAHARLTRLRKAGYTVVADPHGGLVMKASESIAQAARADITRLPALQVPIHELADLAHDLGAEPVPPP